MSVLFNRYDEALSVMDSGFPRKIQSDWPGIGDKVDAAFQFRGKRILTSTFPPYSSIKKKLHSYLLKYLNMYSMACSVVCFLLS